MLLIADRLLLLVQTRRAIKLGRYSIAEGSGSILAGGRPVAIRVRDSPTPTLAMVRCALSLPPQEAMWRLSHTIAVLFLCHPTAILSFRRAGPHRARQLWRRHRQARRHPRHRDADQGACHERCCTRARTPTPTYTPCNFSCACCLSSLAAAATATAVAVAGHCRSRSRYASMRGLVRSCVHILSHDSRSSSETLSHAHGTGTLESASMIHCLGRRFLVRWWRHMHWISLALVGLSTGNAPHCHGAVALCLLFSFLPLCTLVSRASLTNNPIHWLSFVCRCLWVR